MPNHLVIAKLVKAAESFLKPDIVASKYIEQQLEPKFHMTAAGKVRSNSGDLKVRKYLDTVLRNEMPSLFLDVGQADAGGNVKGKNNPFSKEGWSVTQQGSLAKALIAKHGEQVGREKLDQIAKAAGSRAGATKPGATKRLSQSYRRGDDGRPVRVE